MGCCLYKKAIRNKSIPSTNDLSYKQTNSIKIRRRLNSDQFEYLPVVIKYTTPQKIIYQELELKSMSLKISGCVLPGQDPYGLTAKACQDNCYFAQNNNTILLGLNDGHGRYGENVVMFTENFLINNFKGIEQVSDPQFLLHQLTNQVDEALNKCEIDTSVSGATQVLVIITDGVITIGSLGDSRAIIAAQPQKDDIHDLDALDVQNVKLVKRIRQKRQIPIQASIAPIQLTKDQRPNDPQEYQRIIKSGGRVQSLTDKNGAPMGPARVWHKEMNTPGLAMSRSIGDTVAKQLGVINIPIVTSHQFREDIDQFLVIGSDGIWDVMSNAEVVNFVQKYREKCSHQEGQEGNASIKNSSIARLLAEEARLRWVSIVEREDVPIDDISCMIAEFYPIKEDFEQQFVSIPTVHSQFNVRDAFRSSFVEEKYN